MVVGSGGVVYQQTGWGFLAFVLYFIIISFKAEQKEGLGSSATLFFGGYGDIPKVIKFWGRGDGSG